MARVNVTISDKASEVLDRWCEMTGASRSKTVSLFIEQSLPRLEAFMDAMDRGESPDEYANEVLANAERDLKEL